MDALKRVGVDLKSEGLANELTTEGIFDLARRVEKTGFESLWFNEDIGKDSVALLGAISALTKNIGVGSAIINVYSRSALQIAMAAATLDEISHGRFHLGLSVGHHPWNDLGHGIPIEAPLARLREYVQFIRKALTGRQFTHDGRFFSGVNTKLGFRPLRSDLPIYIGGTRPRMVALAGEVADGLITNVVSPYYIANHTAQQFRDGARKAGRDPDSLEFTAIATCCPSEDYAEALSHARAIFMQRFRSNPVRIIETQSPEFHEELRALKSLIESGKAERAQEEVSEGLATSFVAAGNGKELWRTIESYFSAGCTRVLVAPYPRGKESAERLITALAD
ncbi:MAG: LLM class flavin-dependent oxidoreductase [Deltaproteobacteria bacterium]|nr:LLM class flavin-dependent oxidoreductase [Deltaproteobacteria bacterium]